MLILGDGIKYLKSRSIAVQDFTIEAIEKPWFKSFTHEVHALVPFVSKDTDDKVIIHTQMNKSPMVQFNEAGLYLDTFTWNIVVGGCRNGYSVILTNLRYLLEKQGCNPTNDQLKVCIERSLLQGDTVESGLENILKHSERGSAVGQAIRSLTETNKCEFSTMFLEVAYKYEEFIASLESSITSDEVLKSFKCLCKLSEHNQTLRNQFKNNRIVKGLYELLRAIDKDYSFLYLKIAPSLCDKYLKGLGLGGAPNAVELSKALKDYAYNYKYIDIIAKRGPGALAEQFHDLGNVYNRFAEIDRRK